jgi:Protein of unknown function (DUF3311)
VAELEPTRSHRLSPGVAAVAGVLLAIPCVALALVPTYSRRTPILFGWPFFYWYQVLWVLITPVLTYSAFLIIKRARRQR